MVDRHMHMHMRWLRHHRAAGPEPQAQGAMHVGTTGSRWRVRWAEPQGGATYADDQGLYRAQHRGDLGQGGVGGAQALGVGVGATPHTLQQLGKRQEDWRVPHRKRHLQG